MPRTRSRIELTTKLLLDLDVFLSQPEKEGNQIVKLVVGRLCYRDKGKPGGTRTCWSRQFPRALHRPMMRNDGLMSPEKMWAKRKSPPNGPNGWHRDSHLLSFMVTCTGRGGSAFVCWAAPAGSGIALVWKELHPHRSHLAYCTCPHSQ